MYLGIQVHLSTSVSPSLTTGIIFTRMGTHTPAPGFTTWACRGLLAAISAQVVGAALLPQALSHPSTPELCAKAYSNPTGWVPFHRSSIIDGCCTRQHPRVGDQQRFQTLQPRQSLLPRRMSRSGLWPHPGSRSGHRPRAWPECRPRGFVMTLSASERTALPETVSAPPSTTQKPSTRCP